MSRTAEDKMTRAVWVFIAVVSIALILSGLVIYAIARAVL